MTKFEQYFHTDWSAMTGADWVGLLLTVFVFVLMVVVYVYVLNPKNKQNLESHRTMILDEKDDRKSES